MRTVAMMQPGFTLQEVDFLPVNFGAPFRVHSKRLFTRTRVCGIVLVVLVRFARVSHREVPPAAFV